MYYYKMALRNPTAEALDKALDEHRRVMKILAQHEVYRLAEQFADIVLEKVGPRDVEKEVKLLDETIALLEQERARRPECPGLYFALYKLHKLRGAKEKEVYYQELHTRKKAEWDRKAQYDANGRPRCR